MPLTAETGKLERGIMNPKEGLRQSLERVGSQAQNQGLAMTQLSEEIRGLNARIYQLSTELCPAASPDPQSDGEPRRRPPRKTTRILTASIALAAAIGLTIKPRATLSEARQHSRLSWPARPASSEQKETHRAFDGDDDSQGALKLVYSHKLLGQQETILEQVGALSEAFLESSPWKVERLNRDIYLITYRPPGRDLEDESLEFEADLAAKTVVLSPETAARLRAGWAGKNGLACPPDTGENTPTCGTGRGK